MSASECLSTQSKDFDPRQFGISNYGALGDKGIAMKNSTRFDGDSGQGEKFEGEAPTKGDSASQTEYSGH